MSLPNLNSPQLSFYYCLQISSLSIIGLYVSKDLPNSLSYTVHSKCSIVQAHFLSIFMHFTQLRILRKFTLLRIFTQIYAITQFYSNTQFYAITQFYANYAITLFYAITQLRNYAILRNYAFFKSVAAIPVEAAHDTLYRFGRK